MRAAATDVLIRGAGPVGCVAALALRNLGKTVRVLAVEQAQAAFRPIVLSYASRLILERIGVWGTLETTPIEAIHVSQAGGVCPPGFCCAPARGAGRGVVPPPFGPPFVFS